MFFMAEDYHSFTVTVTVATSYEREHARNHSRILGEAVATRDLFMIYSYDSAGFQPGYHGLAPAIAGATTAGGVMSAARHTPPTR
jgi:hypothetical protein